MAQMTWQILATTVTCLIVLYAFSKRTSTRYPPGPRGVPVFGNIFQLNPANPWRTFTKWAETYGPIVYVNAGGQPIVLLNTKKVAEDLLENRGPKYSSRPRLVVSAEMCGNSNIAMLTGERWRKMRRTSEHALGVRSSSNYYDIQSSESALLAHGLLHQTTKWDSHIERAFSSMILSILYDQPVIRSLNDPSVVFMNEVVEVLSNATVPGAYLVDIFPILEHLPRCLSGWRYTAERYFQKFDSRFQQLFLTIKDKVTSGQEQRSSFCSTLAESQKQHTMTDRECAWLSGILYTAGHETTATTLMWFIFAMILHPHIQQRAQRELDQVVGQSRLPSFADAKHLPYVQAILKEILRWRPAIPFGVPHAIEEDDYYEGYYIPKGSICIASSWSINRDPNVYGSNADEFHPERHLDENGHLRDESSEGHFSYGFGQRICVGRHVANNSLFIAMATILWTMTLEPGKDSRGNILKPDINAEEWNGLVIRPPHFEFNATPRFADAESLIQQAREEIMEEVLTHPDLNDI
ncbi:hypothetical protein VKT23_007889 [Stygiomarasmius scandens]|uniref:Cytochrome P450 n=1 Tax=Marasmiellus scandens TaxID=2682957 RepID=A0ABR1JPW0_9AGAR